MEEKCKSEGLLKDTKKGMEVNFCQSRLQN